MKIESIELSKLVLDPSNARKHAVKNLDAIKGSLAKFGQQKPIVVGKGNVVIAGNGTLEAARILGWDKINVVRTQLEGPEAIAFAIADNRTSELAEWDGGVLSETLRSLQAIDFDLGSIGFDADDLAKLIATPIVEGLTDPDEVHENVDTRCKPGDLWVLGSHRLLCGDSTNVQHVERLMGGEKADICFTSPPYNLGANAKLRGYNGDGDDSIYSGNDDAMSDREYMEFLEQFIALAIECCSVVFCNIQVLAGNKLVIPEFWYRYRNHVIDLMVWDKVHAPPQMAERVLNSVWEFIFILTKHKDPKRSIKSGPNFRGTIDNIYRLNPVGKKDPLAKDHGGVFPVQFAEHFVSKFSRSSCYDPFLGSGSTLIACENTGRKCFGMEIDPHYCDVILTRWEQFTGKTASLVPQD